MAEPRRGVVALVSLAVLLAGCLAVSLWRGAVPQPLFPVLPAGEGATRPTGDAGSFHAPPARPPGGTAARCAGCHAHPPHPGPATAAVLLNHHGTVLDCLVCHGGLAVVREGGRFTPAGPPPDVDALRAGHLTRGRCFPRGPACGDCHRRGGRMNWDGLGYEFGRQQRLERLETFFVLPPGGEWFYPAFR